jgi:two-component system OmpR family sensor kinase
VVAAARAHAEDRGVELVHVPGDAPGPVPAAPMAVRRAVTALVDNALDHAQTRVEVAVSSRRGEVAIAVLDDGPGIPPEVMPRIFERFASTRPTPTTAGARRHFGLGLALVADIAAVHGGRVEAGPRPDGGPGAALTLVLRRGR